MKKGIIIIGRYVAENHWILDTLATKNHECCVNGISEQVTNTTIR